MNAKKIAKIAMMAAIQAAVFTIFSQVLYLEGITFVVCLFACVFEKDEAILASLTFGIINMLVQGITIWSIMYTIIYPTYSLIISLCKTTLTKRFYLLVGLCGIFSFLTGQLLELPFLLVSKSITTLYILMGLKTSLIQGCLSAFMCLLIFEPCYKVLIKIKKGEIR